VQFTAVYAGSGREEIKFRLEKPPGLVLYKPMQDGAWGPAEVAINGNGWYSVHLSNIDEQSVYQMMIEGKKYYFKAK
jgi:hypothetical protein